MQKLLLAQVQTLVKQFNISADVEQIAKELWILLVSTINIQRFRNDDVELHGNDFEYITSSDEESNDEDSHETKHRKRKYNKSQNNRETSSEDSDDQQDIDFTSDDEEISKQLLDLDTQAKLESSSNIDYDTDRNETDHIETDYTDTDFNETDYTETDYNSMSEFGNTSGSDFSSKTAPSNKPNGGFLKYLNTSNSGQNSSRNYKSKNKSYRFSRMPRTKVAVGIICVLGKLNIIWTLVISYVSLVLLRYPILIADFSRWVSEEKIPYLSIEKYIPPNWREKITRNHISMLKRKTTPSVKKIRECIMLFAFKFKKLFGLNVPFIDHSIVIYSLVKKLGLPSQFYGIASQVYNVRALYKKSGSRLYQGGNSRATDIYIEKNAAACIIVALRLFYGLDGIYRNVIDEQHLLDVFGIDRAKAPSINELIEFMRLDYFVNYSPVEYFELSLIDDIFLKKYLDVVQRRSYLEGYSSAVIGKVRFKRSVYEMMPEIRDSLNLNNEDISHKDTSGLLIKNYLEHINSQKLIFQNDQDVNNSRNPSSFEFFPLAVDRGSLSVISSIANVNTGSGNRSSLNKNSGIGSFDDYSSQIQFEDLNSQIPVSSLEYEKNLFEESLLFDNNSQLQGDGYTQETNSLFSEINGGLNFGNPSNGEEEYQPPITCLPKINEAELEGTLNQNVLESKIQTSFGRFNADYKKLINGTIQSPFHQTICTDICDVVQEKLVFRPITTDLEDKELVYSLNEKKLHSLEEGDIDDVITEEPKYCSSSSENDISVDEVYSETDESEWESDTNSDSEPDGFVTDEEDEKRTSIDNPIFSGDMIPSYIYYTDFDDSLGSFHKEYSMVLEYISDIVGYETYEIHESVTMFERFLVKHKDEFCVRKNGDELRGGEVLEEKMEERTDPAKDILQPSEDNYYSIDMFDGGPKSAVFPSNSEFLGERMRTKTFDPGLSHTQV
ncbi:hypothetical protein BB559_000525 [Furculomyces boomerangus]|uniref:Uncharacterized protein n=1 Tax=Furculomyces boomerangus TaxID=61424 RepID=A0A2T9Z4X6_9FUNG|nr:hypothetical protein BB559_000525 [Furculomyces boomerangus]